MNISDLADRINERTDDLYDLVHDVWETYNETEAEEILTKPAQDFLKAISLAIEEINRNRKETR